MPDPDDSVELQFERAETVDESARRPRCALCSTEISSTYYERGGQIVCPACHDRLIAERNRGTRLSRFGRALLFGVGAAIAGALLWFGVSKLTGYEFSLIAIVIGFLVGAAVKRGSFGRGGWVYQGLAIFLTYAAIVSTYIPAIVEAMDQDASVAARAGSVAAAPDDSSRAIEPEPGAPAAAEEAAESSPGASSAPASAPPSESAADESSVLGAAQENGLPRPICVVVAFLFLFALAFAAPFLAGFENFIGWIILAIGLYEAWKLNRKATIVFDGPYSIGGSQRTAPPSATSPAELPPAPPPIAP